MRLMFVLLLGLAAACAGPTAAGNQASPETRELPCLSGAFDANASEASLVAAYGTANVSSEQFEDDGGPYTGTRVLTGDEEVMVRWKNDAERSQPANISISGHASAWTGPHALSLGMTIEDLERLNGRPFEILGFDWDLGGQLWDTRGGALSRDLASGCLLFVFFEPRAEQIAESISGDRAIMSNDPALRAARPIVRQIVYRYP